MSTIVYQQGVHHHQPSIEPHHLVEATTMRLKLVAPKPIELVRDKKFHDDDFGGWSCLQSLSNSSQPPKKAMENEFSNYVHPLVRQSSVLKLSQKSLELCTESLGSETGSDTISECESPIFSLLPSPNDGRKSVPRIEETNIPRMELSVPRKEKEKEKSVSRSFPPPLTTISGSNNLQFTPYRENGRLIIQAFEAPPTNAYFQAERSNGRLRLSFWTNNEEEFEENEDIEGNSLQVEVEMGKDNKYHQRLNSCKEDLDGHHHHIHIHGGDKGLHNWEPFLVATS